MKVVKRAYMPTQADVDRFMLEDLERAIYDQGALEVGKEYLVLSIECRCNNGWGVGTWVEVVTMHDFPFMFPMCYFEISDPRPFKFWKCKRYDDGTVSLVPQVYDE